MGRTPRKNRRKGAKKKRQFAFLRRLAIGFYVITGVIGLLATSCLFVLVHDVITQCDYFKASRLKIEGGRRLSHEQIIAAASVKPGVNTLSINLAMVRKRLLAHPWIMEAEVRREIPAGLHIRIREHTPLAIVELDRQYLINENGQVFKEWTAGDPANLPLVSGLAFSDIRRFHKSAPVAAPQPTVSQRYAQTQGSLKRPFEAVMQVLLLGKQVRGVLSNRQIKQILVDREIGLTLKVFKQMKTVVLGYHNYPLKFRMFTNILAYGKQWRSFPDFNRIDLNNVNRIVVNPVIQIPSEDHKEV
ncbi:MAG: FtsQ-type POTRA domain-containing protein [Desulfobacterales bacterium]|jgi:cell division protein FtsQ|nr:FtsQ-type POTRA domain-containing protein [Deltaproteobacteria bacterium]